MGAWPSENAEHIVVAQYLESLGWPLWTHVGNGGYRYPSTGRLLQRLGLHPGVPDLLVFTPGPKSGRPLAIEMKSCSPAARVSPEQKEWLSRLAAIGWECHVCRGAPAALSVLRAAGYEHLPKTPGPLLGGTAMATSEATTDGAAPETSAQSAGLPRAAAFPAPPFNPTTIRSAKQAYRPRWSPSGRLPGSSL